MYEIVNVQYTGTYNNGGTSIPAVLGEFRASSAADLPAQNVDCHIICGCDGLDIATGDRYIWNGAAWILQPSDRAFSNVYTKAEIDAMIANYYTKTESDTLFEWSTVTATITTDTLPLTFKADGTPLISWSMKGNGSQSGTPTPDNPVMPEFVGVRTGNVCTPAPAETKTNNGITVVSNGSGTYHVSGTATADADIQFNVQTFLIPKSITYSGSGTYSMFNSATYANADVKIVFYYHGTKIDDWGLTYLNRTDTNYKIMGEKDCDAIGFTVKSGATVDFTISPEFTNDGVLPNEFEPYGWAEKITCAGQTVPVYLGQTQTVRRIKKLVLTGEENFAKYTQIDADWLYYYALGSANRAAVTTVICTHVIYQSYTAPSSNPYARISDTKSSLLLNLGTAIGNNNVESFKSYLAQQYAAGTPVTIWYVLAEPVAGIVNEPLAKIGDYADELHSTDATVTIPTAKGSNTLSVDTTVQPSEVSITGGIRNE